MMTWSFRALASAPNQLRTVEMKIWDISIIRLVFVQPQSTNISFPLLLARSPTSNLISKGSKSQETPLPSYWSPQRFEVISILHLSPLPDFRGGPRWREISPGQLTSCHISLQFNVFMIPHTLFRGNQNSFLKDQSVRKIEDPLGTSLWFSFLLLISLLIFIKPFSGPQYLHISLLQKERFWESSQFQECIGP